jgi:hypothetical protein
VDGSAQPNDRPAHHERGKQTNPEQPGICTALRWTLPWHGSEVRSGADEWGSWG